MSPYDSVRYYAQERLMSGALQAAHARHTQYFLTQGRPPRPNENGTGA